MKQSIKKQIVEIVIKECSNCGKYIDTPECDYCLECSQLKGFTGEDLK